MKRWRSGHEKETTFQDNKRQKKMFEAFEQGALDTSLVTKGFKAKYDDFVRHRGKQDQRHLQDVERRQRRAHGGVPKPLADIVNMPTFIDKSLEEKDRARVQDWLSKNGVPQVPNRIDAKMFVILNPAAAGERINWVAKICGGYIVNVDILLTGVGIGFAFKAAATTRRQVWISEKFRQKNEGVALCIEGAISNFGKGCKFKVLRGDRTVFEEAHAQARAARRKKEVLALVTEKEKRQKDTCMH